MPRLCAGHFCLSSRSILYPFLMCRALQEVTYRDDIIRLSPWEIVAGSRWEESEVRAFISLLLLCSRSPSSSQAALFLHVSLVGSGNCPLSVILRPRVVNGHCSLLVWELPHPFQFSLTLPAFNYKPSLISPFSHSWSFLPDPEWQGLWHPPRNWSALSYSSLSGLGGRDAHTLLA